MSQVTTMFSREFLAEEIAKIICEDHDGTRKIIAIDMDYDNLSISDMITIKIRRAKPIPVITQSRTVALNAEALRVYAELGSH